MMIAQLSRKKTQQNKDVMVSYFEIVLNCSIVAVSAKFYLSHLLVFTWKKYFKLYFNILS